MFRLTDRVKSYKSEHLGQSYSDFPSDTLISAVWQPVVLSVVDKRAVEMVKTHTQSEGDVFYWQGDRV